MAKRPTLTDTTAGFSSAATQNANNDAIKTAFDNTLSRDGSTPNQMLADLDMNSNRVINVAAGVAGTDAVNVNQATALINTVGEYTTVGSYAALRDLSPSAGDVVQLTGSRAGTFQFNAASLTTEVGNDEVTVGEGDGGIYVAPASDKTGASGAWVRVYSGARDVRWYGAVGDNSTDSTAAIQACIDAAGSDGSVYIPVGRYVISSTIALDNEVSITGDGIGASLLVPSSSALLEAVSFGATTLYKGKARDFGIDRGTYDAATENKGFVFKDCAGAVFDSIESRWSRYNFRFEAGDGQRVSYCTFINISGVDGRYNISGSLAGSGFVNELVFLGGRMFDGGGVETHVFVDFPCNFWRFFGMSVEGNANEAFNINGAGAVDCHSWSIVGCRTEGTWANDDIVLGANTQRMYIQQHDLYATVTDNGQNNSIYTSREGSKISTSDNNTTTLTMERSGAAGTTPAVVIDDSFSASGNSFGLEVRSGRDTADGFVFRAIRRSDDLVRSHLTTRGQFYSSLSSWQQAPLVLGDYHLWIDASGRLRINNGEPASDTDGTIVGTQS